MKKANVEIGGLYVVKVSGVLATVRVDAESPYGGWVGTNVKTGRQVRLRTAGRLRRVAQASPELPIGRRVGTAGEYHQAADGRWWTVNPQTGWTLVPSESRALQAALQAVAVMP